MTLQKWIGIVTSALCLFTGINNAVNFQPNFPLHSISAIIVSAVALVWFFLSIFKESLTLKIGQIIFMLVVSILCVCLNIVPGMGIREVANIVIGMCLFFVTVAVMWAYDIFDVYPKITITMCCGIMMSISSVALGSIISGSSFTAIALAFFATIWKIVDIKIKKLRELTKRAMELAERAEPGENHD